MGKRPQQKAKVTADDFLRARPVQNAAMELQHRPDGTTLASMPLRRPGWMVPPLNWLMPFSSHRRIEPGRDRVDGAGAVRRQADD